MFTGLITAVGRVAESMSTGVGARIRIQTPAGWLQQTAVGDSIAVDGACLTAVEVRDDSFSAEVSPETLACCAPWRLQAAVNLEHALAVGDKLGGHFVTGHVEDVAGISQTEAGTDGGRRLLLCPPPALMPRLINKGSVAVAGVSLTVNRVCAAEFSVRIVPHTRAMTTLGGLPAGAAVNIETDILARHIEKLLVAVPPAGA